MKSPRYAVVGLAVTSAGFTAAVASLPGLHFAYRSAALHTAVETIAVLVLVLAMFLIAVRMRRQPLINEVGAAAAFAFLAVSNVTFALLPALGGNIARNVGIWDGRIASLVAALLLAVAAAAPGRHPARPESAVLTALGGVVAVMVSMLLAVWLLHGLLPRVTEGTVPVSPLAWPDVHGSHTQLALYAVGALLLGLAAFGFLRRSERLGDEFYAWLATTAVLLAFSRINYALYPTRYTDYVYVGDGFRLLSYLVLLGGAMREIDRAWRFQRDLAVLEERRRIARDLHDGLAQEIAYVGRNLGQLVPADPAQADLLERLRGAAGRAQLESRQALQVLATNADEPLELELARALTEVSDRFGADLDLELASGVLLSPTRRECVLRIANEAVANAARHSGATRIRVRLERRAAGVFLSVRDPGCGFDVAEPSTGFGLVTMRERARSVGARLTVDSAPGRGTTVEVAL